MQTTNYSLKKFELKTRLLRLKELIYGEKIMNVFVRGTVATGARVLHEKIKEDMKRGAEKFVTDWRFAEVNEKEFMACMNVTDMEAMGAFMSSPEELQWDKDNGCEYTVYGMEEMPG
ncbi:MAG: hypothetical protein CMH00_07540 [Marinovum sp.]|nr:hypothetical protein [Marinovum sp.]